MEKPAEPSKEDCCNSGCTPCIFDIYERQLRLYEKYLEDGETFVNISEENGISQLAYTQFMVVKSVDICDMHKLILFKREKLDNKKVWWVPGQHFLLKYTTDELACTRAYTPVFIQNEPRTSYDFSIVVKKYNDGVVSTRLHALTEGCLTSWRGPYGYYEMEPNKFNRMIMIAQGTGIAPFVSIINHILNNEDDMTKIILLYCCTSVNTILFRDLFYNYKSYWNFQYRVYTSIMSINVKPKYQEPITQSKLSIEDLCSFKPFSSKDQILICGSEKFVKDYDEYFREECSDSENIFIF